MYVYELAKVKKYIYIKERRVMGKDWSRER